MGVPHTLGVLGDEEAVLLQTHPAASFLNLIKAVGVRRSIPGPDMATLDSIAMNVWPLKPVSRSFGPPMSVHEAMAIVAAIALGRIHAVVRSSEEFVEGFPILGIQSAADSNSPRRSKSARWSVSSVRFGVVRRRRVDDVEECRASRGRGRLGGSETGHAEELLVDLDTR